MLDGNSLARRLLDSLVDDTKASPWRRNVSKCKRESRRLKTHGQAPQAPDNAQQRPRRPFCIDVMQYPDVFIGFGAAKKRAGAQADETTSKESEDEARSGRCERID